MYRERIIDEIKAIGIPDLQKCIPCTEEEVSTLEQQLHLLLPKAYKAFLLMMGKGADAFLAGSDFLYDQLSNLQDVAREILAEDEFPEKLPEDAFIFFLHQGYQFNFFRASGEDDPPVYRYFEGRDREIFPMIYHHFTDFLIFELRDHANAIQRRQRVRPE